jgi:hypothetical protein
MPHYELHIAGQIIIDNDINVLYNTIAETDLEWEIYKICESKSNPVKVTNKKWLSQEDIDTIKNKILRKGDKQSICRKYHLSYPALMRLLTNGVH